MQNPGSDQKPSRPSAWRAAFTIICIVAILLLILFGAGCTMTQTVEINKDTDDVCIDEKAVRAYILLGNTVECKS